MKSKSVKQPEKKASKLEATPDAKTATVRVTLWAVSADGSPAEGVLVSFDNDVDSKTAKTDPNGHAEVELRKQKEYLISSRIVATAFTQPATRKFKDSCTAVLVKGRHPLVCRESRTRSNSEVDFYTFVGTTPAPNIPIAIYGPSCRTFSTNENGVKMGVRLVAGDYYITSGGFANPDNEYLDDGVSVDIIGGNGCTVHA